MRLTDFKRLVCEDKLSICLTAADGRAVCVEPRLNLVISDDFTEQSLEVAGYEVTEDTDVKTFESFEETVAYLEKCGAVYGGEVALLNISGIYKTLEEYERKRAFDNITMAGLLEKYLPVADSFSLTCPYDGESVYISGELAENALDDLKNQQKQAAKGQYDLLSEEEKRNLPPFEELFDKISEEYRAYCKKHAAKLKKYGGEVFFADEFMRGKTAYTAPDRLWHIYHAVDFIGTCGFSLGKMKNDGVMLPLDNELNGVEYQALKDSLISTEVTFCWHCTVSGQLSKVFYFSLNEKTVEWLSAHKDDYDFEYLEDLAFYGKEKLLFSSCTHERFHSDFTDAENADK